jgi:predicted NBD/HSP70 family sugar kinase
VLAFDVGVDRLVAARVGLGGVILDRREAVRNRDAFDLDEVVSVLAKFARQMLRKTRPGTVCVGAGAAFCGVVRRADGVIRFGPNIGQAEVPFGAALTHELDLDLTVTVDNDANLGALAEHQRGVASSCQDLIYLHGDVGIGGGIIVGGRLLGGEGGYGGELGHMVVNPRGRLCGCGSSGCLEAEVGERALLTAAGRGEGKGLIGRDAVRAIVDAAERGDVVARDALHRVGDWLGFGIANLVNIFNPEMVIFGGILREIYLSSAAQVRSRLKANTMAAFRESVRLRTSELGDDATLVGAAELAFAEVLANPVEVLARMATEGPARAAT